ncbi:hypothetical protein AB5I41_03485 [Sphingomonas sp. MMS24-JH45]
MLMGGMRGQGGTPRRAVARARRGIDGHHDHDGWIAAFMVRGGGDPLAGWSHGTLAITTASQFPTMQPDAAPADRPRAAAALAVVVFYRPQGRGWYKGWTTTRPGMSWSASKRQRCVVVLSNDVRAERAFPSLVAAILGANGVPWRV